MANASRDNMGIDRKPKRSRDAVEHDTFWLQGAALAQTIPSCSKLWYNATANPPKARGSEYLTTFTSKGKSGLWWTTSAYWAW